MSKINPTPLVSVIMPMYNVEEYVEKALNSLQKQTYKNIEILVINDGSTDNSLNIANAYASKDNRIKILSKINGGVSSARNLGLKASTGEYITFVDPDDWVENNYVEHLYNVLTESQAELSICSFISHKPKKIKVKQKKLKIEAFSPNEAIREFLLANTLFPGIACKLLKRDLVEGMSFDENIFYAEDSQFMYEYTRKCSKIVASNQKLYHYIKRSSSITHMRFNSKLMTIFDFIDNQIQLESNTELKTYCESHKFLLSVEMYYRLKKSKQLNSPYAIQLLNNLKEFYPSFQMHKKEYKTFRRWGGLGYKLMKLLWKPKIK